MVSQRGDGAHRTWLVSQQRQGELPLLLLFPPTHRELKIAKLAHAFTIPPLLLASCCSQLAQRSSQGSIDDAVPLPLCAAALPAWTRRLLSDVLGALFALASLAAASHEALRRTGAI